MTSAALVLDDEAEPQPVPDKPAKAAKVAPAAPPPADPPPKKHNSVFALVDL